MVLHLSRCWTLNEEKKHLTIQLRRLILIKPKERKRKACERRLQFLCVFAQLRGASRYVKRRLASRFSRLCTHLQASVYVSFMRCTSRGKAAFSRTREHAPRNRHDVTRRDQCACLPLITFELSNNLLHHRASASRSFVDIGYRLAIPLRISSGYRDLLCPLSSHFIHWNGNLLRNARIFISRPKLMWWVQFNSTTAYKL